MYYSTCSPLAQKRRVDLLLFMPTSDDAIYYLDLVEAEYLNHT